jgi:hypothetical protein
VDRAKIQVKVIMNKNSLKDSENRDGNITGTDRGLLSSNRSHVNPYLKNNLTNRQTANRLKFSKLEELTKRRKSKVVKLKLGTFVKKESALKKDHQDSQTP